MSSMAAACLPWLQRRGGTITNNKPECDVSSSIKGIGDSRSQCAAPAACCRHDVTDSGTTKPPVSTDCPSSPPSPPSIIKQDTCQQAPNANYRSSKSQAASRQCDANAVRDSLIMSTTSEMITIVTLSGEECIYQNPASVAWLGRYCTVNTPRTSVSSLGDFHDPLAIRTIRSEKAGGAEVAAAAAEHHDYPFPSQHRNHNRQHHNHQHNKHQHGVLYEIFSREPDKLQLMWKELTRDNDGRRNEWKGLVRMNVRKTPNTAAAAATSNKEPVASEGPPAVRTPLMDAPPFLATSLPFGATAAATAATAAVATTAAAAAAAVTQPMDAESPTSPSAVSCHSFCSGGFGGQVRDEDGPDGGGGGGCFLRGECRSSGTTCPVAVQRSLRRRSLPALGQHRNQESTEALLNTTPGMVLSFSERLQLEAALNLSYGECASTGGSAVVGCRINAGVAGGGGGDDVDKMERLLRTELDGIAAEDEVSEREPSPRVGVVVSETASGRRTRSRGRLATTVKSSVGLPLLATMPPQRRRIIAVPSYSHTATGFVRTTPCNSNTDDMDQGESMGVGMGPGTGGGGGGPYGQGVRVLPSSTAPRHKMSYRRHSMDSVQGSLNALTPIPSSSALPSLAGIPYGERYDTSSGGSGLPAISVPDPDQATAVTTTRSMQLQANDEMPYDSDDMSPPIPAVPKPPPICSAKNVEYGADGLPSLSSGSHSLRNSLRRLLSRVLHRNIPVEHNGGVCAAAGSSGDDPSSSGDQLGSSAATTPTAAAAAAAAANTIAPSGGCRTVYGDVRPSDSSSWPQRRHASEAVPAVLPEARPVGWLTLADGTAAAAAAAAEAPQRYSSASSMRAAVRLPVSSLKKALSYNAGIPTVEPPPPLPPMLPPPPLDLRVRIPTRLLPPPPAPKRRGFVNQGEVRAGSSMPNKGDDAVAVAAAAGGRRRYRGGTAAAAAETEEISALTVGGIDDGGVSGCPFPLPYRPRSAVAAPPPLGRSRSCRRVFSLPVDRFLEMHNSHLRTAAAAGGSGTGSGSGINLSAGTTSYCAATKAAAPIWATQPQPMSMPLPLAMPLHAVTFAGSLRTAPPSAFFLTGGTTSLKKTPSVRVPTGSDFMDGTAQGGGGGGSGGGGGGTGLMGLMPMLDSPGSMSSVRSSRTEMNPDRRQWIHRRGSDVDPSNFGDSASATIAPLCGDAPSSCLTPGRTAAAVEEDLVSEHSVGGTSPAVFPHAAPAPSSQPAVPTLDVYDTKGLLSQEIWHEVWARRAVDPILGEEVVIVAQHDVTARVVSERHLALVMETEHRLLEQLYPRHILEGIVEDWTAHCAAEDSLATDNAVAAASASVAATAAAAAAAAAASTSLSCSWRPGVRNPYALATWHPEVTLLFADICGFTPLCMEMEPRTVMHLLNALFSRFDSHLDTCGVFKVETIGDCYFVAGGLVDTDEDGMTTVRSRCSCDMRQHALRVFKFAQAMLSDAKEVIIPTTGKAVQIRIGIHSGPVVSGVVGTRMPRFCLFGDTVNTASRMESTGVQGAVHVSEMTYSRLKDLPGWMPTGGVEVKGKGHMTTYINFCNVQREPIT